MPLPPVRLGQRYAARLALPLDGAGAGATDVVGTLVAADATSWTLLPDDRGPVTLPVTRLLAARAVPPRAVRPSSSIDDVQRLAARGWPGLSQERLGGWLLRSGAGFSGRANSALVAGDPGLPLAQAIDAVEGHYRAQGLVPRWQLAYPLDGSDDPAGDVDAALAARGYPPENPTSGLPTSGWRHRSAPPRSEDDPGYAPRAPQDSWRRRHVLAVPAAPRPIIPGRTSGPWERWRCSSPPAQPPAGSKPRRPGATWRRWVH